MNNKISLRFCIFFLAILVSLPVIAQNSQRDYQACKISKGKLDVFTNEGTYKFRFYNDNIIETAYIPNKEDEIANSHSVIMQAGNGNYTFSDKRNSLKFASKGLAVCITKRPFSIKYTYKGKEILAEKNGYIKTDSTENIDFTIHKDEVLFGGGARALGMNRRGNRLQLYNRAHYGYGTRSELMNYTMPLVISSKKYAIHFDNAPIGFLDLDSKNTNTLRYESIGGRKVYQVIAADTWQNFTYQLTKLTGRQPMPPRWSLGNFSSRFGYHSEKETRETIDQFIQDSIPVDAIILDLYWFGKNIKGDMGNLAFQTDSFPNPSKMIADLNQKGVKTILITEPFILTTSSRWQEAVNEEILCTDRLGSPFTYDFYFGNTGLIDIFKPKAIDWFWNIYKNLTQKGVAGWWGDLGEPEVHPKELQHTNGSADEVHNIYGHYWAKMIYEGYKKDFPEQRPFILMRAGAVGSQRYGMIPWTGDVSRSWDGLVPQTEIALQMGMQGVSFMHSDLGGFAGANLDDELYTRWLQYGVFQPVFRPHAQEEVPSEPVFRDSKTKELAKKSIQLRYQLMPYNYTLAFENNQAGIPLMRPLFFDEQNNKKLLSISDTYLWGNAFLISTITKAGLKEKSIYMPANSVWYDFISGKKYQGGQNYTVQTREDHIPVFVRAGSFVPMIKGMQNTRDYSLENFELHYYHDKSVAESKGKLYNDDGKTPEAFEKGKYELLNFTAHFDGRKLQLGLATQKGDRFIATKKTINWIIHHINNEPKKVTQEKKPVDFTWDKKTKTLRFISETKVEGNQSIIIKLNKK